MASQSIEEGYGRLDALNRIGNQVFSLDLKKPENYRGSSAPVHYPRIWNTPWFDWVQYNGSIMQPMVRNAGESLGVSAELNLTEPGEGTVQIERGCRHPARDGADDRRQGAEREGWLFGPEVAGMAGRHPAQDRPEAGRARAANSTRSIVRNATGHRSRTRPRFFDFDNKKEWRTNQIGQPVMVMENIPIDHVGTDSAQAADMLARTVELPANLGINQTGFADALKDLVEKTVNVIYDRKDPPLNQKQRDAFDGNMPNKILGELAYKVRPLNGVWATPPYLHNGFGADRLRPALAVSTKGRSNSISATANMIR